MADKVITGPLALIKVRGTTVGKMRNIRVTENFQRGSVQGIGQLNKDEVPVLSFTGTVTCDFYNIDFVKSSIPGAIIRDATSIKQFIDTLILAEEGIQLDIFRKVRDAVDEKGRILSSPRIYATITDMFLDSEGFDIADQGISGRNQSFQYLSPIIINNA